MGGAGTQELRLAVLGDNGIAISMGVDLLSRGEDAGSDTLKCT